MEGKKKKIQEGMLGKNCQAHVTVLRTCSMSYGQIYMAIIDSWPIYTAPSQLLWGVNILVQEGVLGQNR